MKKITLNTLEQACSSIPWLQSFIDPKPWLEAYVAPLNKGFAKYKFDEFTAAHFLAQVLFETIEFEKWDRFEDLDAAFKFWQDYELSEIATKEDIAAVSLAFSGNRIGHSQKLLYFTRAQAAIASLE